MAYVDDRSHFLALLQKLNILNREAAEMIGVTERTIYKWLSGDRRVPSSAIRLLELLLEKKRSKVK